MYVALFPCNECAKLIIQSGMSEVVFMSDKYHDKPEMIASRRLLNMAGIKYRYIFSVHSVDSGLWPKVNVALYPGSLGAEEKEPGTHCFYMCKIITGAS